MTWGARCAIAGGRLTDDWTTTTISDGNCAGVALSPTAGYTRTYTHMYMHKLLLVLFILLGPTLYTHRGPCPIHLVLILRGVAAADSPAMVALC